MQRIGPYAEQDTRYESTLDRQMDFKLEVEEWMKGTLIFGRGLTYFSAGSYESYDTDDVAWDISAMLQPWLNSDLLACLYIHFYYRLLL